MAQGSHDSHNGAADGRGDVGTSVPWYWSLRTRLVVLSCLCGAIVLLGVGAVIYVQASRALIEQSRLEIQDHATQSARGLDTALQSVSISAATLALGVQGMGRAPEHLRALLRAKAEGDPNIVGAMLILEPGALAPDDPGFTWYARQTPDGYFEQPMVLPGYDYHAKAWWQRTARDKRGWWSEPYRNRATGEQQFVTWNQPILAKDDRFVGMVSVDVPVARLRDLVGQSPTGQAMTRMLLSPHHLFVVYPDPKVELKQTFEQRLDDPRLASLRPMLGRWSQGREAEGAYKDPATGKRTQLLLVPVGDTGWTLGITVTEEYILRHLRETTRNAVILTLLAILASLLGVRLVARRIADPILGLSESARHMVGGDFDVPLPHTQRLDEVGVMARAFDQARRSMKSQLRSIERMGAARAKLESELSIAHEIQFSMLPPAPAMRAGAHAMSTHAVLEPARAIGGDFYFFRPRGEHRLWFAIGDVSDKGVPAALFMARAITVLEVAFGEASLPSEALSAAGVRLSEGNETCMFATVLCGVLDVSSGEIALASAGHDPPVLLRVDGTTQALGVASGPPLGLSDTPETYSCWSGRLASGEALVAYTDGVTEAFNRDREAFGEERLLSALLPGDTPEAMCRRLVGAVHAFAGGAEQSDDITVLVVALADSSARETTELPLRFHMPEHYQDLRDLLAHLDLALKARGQTAAMRHDVRLLVEEVVSNAIGHGGALDHAGGSVRVECEPIDEGLRLEIRDTGAAFDPLSHDVVDVDADILERPIGGLGVHLVREVASQLHYARLEPFNVLSLVLSDR